MSLQTGGSSSSWSPQTPSTRGRGARILAGRRNQDSSTSTSQESRLRTSPRPKVGQDRVKSPSGSEAGTERGRRGAAGSDVSTGTTLSLDISTTCPPDSETIRRRKAANSRLSLFDYVSHGVSSLFLQEARAARRDDVSDSEGGTADHAIAEMSEEELSDDQVHVAALLEVGADQLASGISRLSLLAHEWGQQAAAAAAAAAAENAAGGRTSRSNSGSTEAPGETLQESTSGLAMDVLVKEAQSPFRKLLLEVPDPEGPGGVLAAFTRLRNFQTSPSEQESGRSPLLSALIRARLITHLVSCYEAVAAEMDQDEARLWECCVALDESLSGALLLEMPTHSDSWSAGSRSRRKADIIASMMELTNCEEKAEACFVSFSERAEDDELDFADVLDVFREMNRQDLQWSLRSSLRNSITHFLGVGKEVRPSQVPLLRARSGRMEPLKLALAAAAYQRCLVLTCSWKCEQQLLRLLRSSTSSSGGNEILGCELLGALLAVLRQICSELAPSELVIWELLGTSDHDFDGYFQKNEVLAAMRLLAAHHAEQEEATSTSGELEELRRLRADCQTQSIEDLFSKSRASLSGRGRRTSTSQRRNAVNLADVFRWWWDMKEDYRVAVGLDVPSALLLRSQHRQVEEMFRIPLRRLAEQGEGPRHDVSLCGHVRTFAELRGLAVRRTIEGLHCQTPTETRTTGSEAEFFSEQGDGTTEPLPTTAAFPQQEAEVET